MKNKTNRIPLTKKLTHGILIYLNSNWKDEYGGHLELWNEDMTKPVKKIKPKLGTVVIFNTGATSWHGHPEPLTCPEDRTRKSLALYYFTDGRPSKELYKTILTHKKRVHSTVFNIDKWKKHKTKII